MPSDPYQIPGTQPIQPPQSPEHPTVERRSKQALNIALTALIVALIAAFISFLQWKAADRQADIADKALKIAEAENQLNTTMVKAANAAFFEPTFMMSAAEGYVDVSFQNTGKVLARGFSATLVISRKAIPGYINIGNPQTIRIERSQIPPLKPSAGQTVALGGYGNDDITRIEQMREVISVEGSFQYGNGFGDLVKQSVCLFYVDLRNPHNGGSSGFMPCEDAKSAVTLTRKR